MPRISSGPALRWPETLAGLVQNKALSRKTTMNTKQVIVMRTDTDPPMRKGKMIAQGAHASIAFLARQAGKGRLDLTPAQAHWMKSSFAKICLRVDSESDLMALYGQAKAAGLEVHLITDSGKTEFKEPTRTCLAIGPDEVAKIDAITGHLKLL